MPQFIPVLKEQHFGDTLCRSFSVFRDTCDIEVGEQRKGTLRDAY